MPKLAFVLAVALAACGGKPSAPPPATPATLPDKAAPITLELGELKIVDTKLTSTFTISANGDVKDGEGTLRGTVSADGKYRTATGKELLVLMPDGALTQPDGERLEVVFAADGSVSSQGRTLSIDAQGNLVGDDDPPTFRIEGATSPGLKRTALFVMLGKMQEHLPTTPVLPPPPTQPSAP